MKLYIFFVSGSPQQASQQNFHNAHHASVVLYPPDDVEDGRYEELVVDGRRHVTRLVESRGNGADSVAEVHAPKQEEELR